VKTFFDLNSLLARREMTVFPLNVKQGYSVWVGALARIDLVSGTDKYLTFVCPTDVTVHRTPIERAMTVFTNQCGKLLKPSYLSNPNLEEDERMEESQEILTNFVKHEIALNCNDFKEANFEIVIEGLGWISVQGKGFVNFIVHLPEGVKIHVRDEPMQPFLAKDKGLKRFSGNTINARTKRNTKYENSLP
jgi:30S ribosome assembly GTPase